MEAGNEERVARWIRNIRFDPNYASDAKPLCQLRIVHLGSRKDEPIYTISEIEGDEEEMARTLVSYAEMDANGIRGIQHYSVQAYFGNRKQASAKIRFCIDATENMGTGDVASEGESYKGQVKYFMRHNENMAKILMGSLTTLVHGMQRTNDIQQQRITQLEERATEQAEAYETILNMQHERDLTRLKAEASEKRKDEIMGMVKMLGPAAVNRMGGKNILPGAKAPMEVMVEELVNSMDQDQMMEIASKLRPEQQAAFMTLFNEVLNAKKDS